MSRLVPETAFTLLARERRRDVRVNLTPTKRDVWFSFGRPKEPPLSSPCSRVCSRGAATPVHFTARKWANGTCGDDGAPVRRAHEVVGTDRGMPFARMVESRAK